MKAANVALLRSGSQICKSLELDNSDGGDLTNVVAVCTGEYLTESRSVVMAQVSAGATVKASGLDIKPDYVKVAALTEGVGTTFKISVYADGDNGAKKVVAEEIFPIAIMAFDQWLGLTIIPQSITEFITPNHADVKALLVKAAEKLKEMTGSANFTGYQSNNVNEVCMQVAAIFGAIHDCGIVYRSLPASFDSIGQRVTLPSEVLRGKLGNCIELTLLFASVLEAASINSVIIFTEGHAFLGVWLVDDCCRYSVSDDASYIEKKISKGISEMMVVECTDLTKENATIGYAQQAAEKTLAETEKFQMFIDVRRCRLEHFLPLPIVTSADGAIKVVEGVSHEEADLDLTEHSRYDLNKVAADAKELTRPDIWERKLLDFSLRNSMLNLSLRRKAIQCISFDVSALEDSIQDGKEYEILPKPESVDTGEQESRFIRSKQMSKCKDLIVGEVKQQRLHTYLPEGETKTTLKNIYRTARNAVEETGANSLYLAIGALRWYETDKSDKERYAPILMLPIDMVYKKGSYFIRTRDEDVMLNITLVELLRQNFGIQIQGLDPLPADEHGVDVQLIFSIIRNALANQKRWDVEEECIIGVFSFSKYLMWNDVHNHRAELLENKIVKSLAEQKLAWQPDAVVTTLRKEDKEIAPQELALPVAADSSQMAAVYEAGKGHSFILYGPPGTGKSQTITNLIANALFQGKRVLFVAEKMAALEVVQKRLAKINLGAFCLEMHSNKVTKKHILNQLGQALAVAHIASSEDYRRTADELFQKRKALIDYIEALHKRDDITGLSIYDCIQRNAAIEGEPMKGFYTNETMHKSVTSATLNEIELLLGSRLLAVTKLVGQPSKHPLVGLQVNETDTMNNSGLKTRLQQAIDQMKQYAADKSELSKAAAMKADLLKDNDASLLKEDGKTLRDEWRQIKSKWFLPKFFDKRSFLKKIKEYNQYATEEELDGILDKLYNYQELQQKMKPIQQVCSNFFHRELTENELPTAEEEQKMNADLQRWNEYSANVKDWYHWSQYCEELRAKGLNCVIDALEQTDIQPAAVKDAFLKAFFADTAQTMTRDTAVLRTFEGMIFDEQVEQYRKLAERFRILSQKELYARLAAKIPRITDNLANSSEIGYLNRNISNGGRGTSLRDIIDHIPNLMPNLCPVMLMSPMSVAQYLPLSQEKFDLVIFDEASQMPTSEAVGAIARGKGLVVVGDPKQMPPTSFFTTTSVDEEEADIDDLESILEDCRTLEIPSLQLNWHYRSRHESLIAFSNNEYYEGKLITFPSCDDQAKKVSLVKVDGVYDKGGRRSNRTEAEQVVAEVVSRLRAGRTESIGIIAFSVVQQNLIEDLLQEELDKDQELHAAADALYESIFVKNLENAQGDERDVILFSIGYGPDKDGKISLNFGPLNNAGGERRLNVAVSRARKEMKVFSSMKASQIDLKRSKAEGVKGLQHFLDYADRGVLVETGNSGANSNDTSIANEIAKAINAKGYPAKVNVGRSQFKINVAVSMPDNPDTYVMGILLDGEGYYNTVMTRDREICQPSVLEGLGWTVMRVWAVDWLNSPNRVISRIIETLEAIKNGSDKEEASSGASASATSSSASAAQTASDNKAATSEPSSETAGASDATAKTSESDSSSDSYNSASKPITSAGVASGISATTSKPVVEEQPLRFNPEEEEEIEMPSAARDYEEYEASAAELRRMSDRELISEMIYKEQPIKLPFLILRYCDMRGVDKVTPKLKQQVASTARIVSLQEQEGDTVVLWKTQDDINNFTWYRPDEVRDADMIPWVEYGNALLEVLREQVAVGTDDIVMLTAKKLGFLRKSKKIETAVSGAIAKLLSQKKIIEENGKLKIAG